MLKTSLIEWIKESHRKAYPENPVISFAKKNGYNIEDGSSKMFCPSNMESILKPNQCIGLFYEGSIEDIVFTGSKTINTEDNVKDTWNNSIKNAVDALGRRFPKPKPRIPSPAPSRRIVPQPVPITPLESIDVDSESNKRLTKRFDELMDLQEEIEFTAKFNKESTGSSVTTIKSVELILPSVLCPHGLNYGMDTDAYLECDTCLTHSKCYNQSLIN